MTQDLKTAIRKNRERLAELVELVSQLERRNRETLVELEKVADHIQESLVELVGLAEVVARAELAKEEQ